MNVHTLYVRHVPDEVHDALHRRARELRSSVSSEAIRLLARALRSDRVGLRDLLDAIEQGRPVARPRTPAAARLIRRERARR